MPTRKQRRRREKLKRHEYEYVIETEEGEKIAVESPREARGRDKGRDEQRKPARGQPTRGGRVVPEPSFGRVLRRSAVFAPLMALVIYFLSRNEPNFSYGQLLFTVLLLLAFFMPFSYMVDVLVYRMAQRRQQRERTSRRS